MISSSGAGLKNTVRVALTLKEIVRPILPYLNEVEECLNRTAEESDGILKESSSYVLSGGGKRLRAALVIFCASTPSESFKKKKSIIDAASAVELIHAATLVHDDIIDHAVLRRLKPTANIQFGEEVALLLGDYLYSKAFNKIAGIEDGPLTAEFARTTQGMCEGELDQLKHRFRADLTLEEYFSFIERKTASLISVCCRAGARLAGLPKDFEEALAGFGFNIGVSFQIVDDLLDIVGSENKLGKTLRNDTGNGKVTLPLILLIKELNEKDKKKILHDLSLPSPDWKIIQPLLEEKKISEQTQKYADQFLNKAMAHLECFDLKFRVQLENLSRFVLHRDY